MKESIDISQEKGGKGKEKTLGYYKGSERKKKRATERQEETAWARLKEGPKKGRRLKQAS